MKKIVILAFLIASAAGYLGVTCILPGRGNIPSPKESKGKFLGSRWDSVNPGQIKIREKSAPVPKGLKASEIRKLARRDLAGALELCRRAGGMDRASMLQSAFRVGFLHNPELASSEFRSLSSSDMASLPDDILQMAVQSSPASSLEKLATVISASPEKRSTILIAAAGCSPAACLSYLTKNPVGMPEKMKSVMLYELEHSSNYEDSPQILQALQNIKSASLRSELAASVVKGMHEHSPADAQKALEFILNEDVRGRILGQIGKGPHAAGKSVPQ